MEVWWQSLDLPLRAFYTIGIVSGLMLLFQLVMTLFGLGSDHFSDAAIEHPDDLGILSIRTVTGFFFGFGWTGVLFMQWGFGMFPTLIAAGGVGCGFLFGIYALMRLLFSMRSSGTLDYRNAVGQTGTVYVTIPAARSGSGQVEVLVQGRLAVVSAMSANAKPLCPGTKVKILDTVDTTTLDVDRL